MIILCLLLTGCGYGLHKGPEFSTVRLLKIENRTFEPKLGDRLSEALSLALMKNGIRIDERASHAVSGTLEEFRLRGLTEKQGITASYTASYEVIIKGKFFLTGPEGQSRQLRSGRAFIVTFSGDGKLELVTARKEEAIKQALADMSEGIVASIIYWE